MRDYVELTYGGLPYTEYPRTLVRWLIDKFDMKPNVLLDVGCGRGEYVAAFREHGFHAHGIDRLDFDFDGNLDSKVYLADYILCKSVVEHLRNPAKLVSWMYHTIWPNGRVIIITPDWKSCYRTFYCDCTHYSPFTVESAREMLEWVGFQNVTSELIRPSGLLMKWPRLSSCLIPLANVLRPSRGPLQYLRNQSRMVLASGIKPVG